MLIRFAGNLAERFHFRWRKVFMISGLCILTYLVCLYLVQVITYLWRYTFATGPTMLNLIADVYYHGINWTAMKFVHLAAIMVILMFLYKHYTSLKVDSRNFKYSRSGIYGTAQYLKNEEAQDIVKVCRVEEADGMILGRLDPNTTEHVVVYRPDASGNHNVAVFGSSGSGKTVNIVMPALLQYVKARHSMVISDIKGEIYQKTYMLLRNSGYRVLKYDLNQMNTSDSWNIISTISGNASEIQQRTDMVVDIIARNSSIAASVFEAPARLLLKAAILRVVLGDDFPPEQKNLTNIYRVLSDQSVDMNTWFDAMKHPEAAVACKIFKSVASSSANAWANILTTVVAALGIFDTPAVQAVTSYDNIRITDLGDQPTVLFVIPNQSYTFLSSLMFYFLFKDLMLHADQNERPGVPENSLNVPVHFLLDEFAQLGYIPEFCENLAQIRSRGITCLMILQDIGQLNLNYKLQANSILGNCSIQINIGCNDQATAEYISKRSGTATVQVETVQHPKGESLFTFSHRRSTGDGKRELYTLDEVYRFPKNQAIIVFQQKNVYPIYKFAYFDHPVMKAGKLIRPTAESAIPPLMIEDENDEAVYNKTARDAYYRQMDQDIADWNAAHPAGKTEEPEKVSRAQGFINTVKDAYDDAKLRSTKQHKKRKKKNSRIPKIRLQVQKREDQSGTNTEPDDEPEPIVVTLQEDQHGGNAFADIFSDPDIVEGYFYTPKAHEVIDAEYITVDEGEEADFNTGTDPVSGESCHTRPDIDIPEQNRYPAAEESPKEQERTDPAGGLHAVAFAGKDVPAGTSAVQKTEIHPEQERIQADDKISEEQQSGHVQPERESKISHSRFAGKKADRQDENPQKPDASGVKQSVKRAKQRENKGSGRNLPGADEDLM